MGGVVTDRAWWRALVSGLIALLMWAPGIQADDRASVTVRIDDYATVAGDVLARAQDEVTQMYAMIGVDTTWLKPRRMAKRRFGLSLLTGDPAPDVTVMVLSQSMTNRIAPPEDALGLAATSATERGHIAYVFYDRLRSLTRQCHVSDVTALTLVLAHEIGHLLLPHGTHSDTGVMRGRWDRERFRLLDTRQLGFTPVQGQQMRRVARSLRPLALVP